MMFCPKCGNLMIAGKKKGYLVCRKCGYKVKTRRDLKLTESIKREKKEIVVIEKAEAVSELPVTKMMCPKCGNMEAYWWMQQTRAADEPPTMFYKCTKCGYTWRSYG